jgi:hypothetical protein
LLLETPPDSGIGRQHQGGCLAAEEYMNRDWARLDVIGCDWRKSYPIANQYRLKINEINANPDH